HDGGKYCGSAMECFTGANFNFGTRTAGHTVITSGNAYSPELQAHEYAHVADFEASGGHKFYADYAAGYMQGAVTALANQDQMIEQYERLYPSGDSAVWFLKVAYALSPKEVAARKAETEEAG